MQQWPRSTSHQYRLPLFLVANRSYVPDHLGYENTIVAKRDSFLLRLNPTTMDALRRWSEDEFRSMNSQIEMVLQRALKEAGRLPEKSNSPIPDISTETLGKTEDPTE